MPPTILLNTKMGHVTAWHGLSTDKEVRQLGDSLNLSYMAILFTSTFKATLLSEALPPAALDGSLI
jgi:hypothetical protein